MEKQEAKRQKAADRERAKLAAKQAKAAERVRRLTLLLLM